jgi:hypothetical protein
MKTTCQYHSIPQDGDFIIKRIMGAAQMYNRSDQPQTKWEQMKAAENPDQPYYPWESLEEFELVDWLASSELLQAKINTFLALAWVRIYYCQNSHALHSPFLSHPRTDTA